MEESTPVENQDDRDDDRDNEEEEPQREPSRSSPPPNRNTLTADNGRPSPTDSLPDGNSQITRPSENRRPSQTSPVPLRGDVALEPAETPGQIMTNTESALPGATDSTTADGNQEEAGQGENNEKRPAGRISIGVVIGILLGLLVVVGAMLYAAMRIMKSRKKSGADGERDGGFEGFGFGGRKLRGFTLLGMGTNRWSRHGRRSASSSVAEIVSEDGMPRSGGSGDVSNHLSTFSQYFLTRRISPRSDSATLSNMTPNSMRRTPSRQQNQIAIFLR